MYRDFDMLWKDASVKLRNLRCAMELKETRLIVVYIDQLRKLHFSILALGKPGGRLPIRLAQAMFLTCIREVPGSNISPDTILLVRFLVVFLSPSKKMPD
jgi:hypothetical protein